MWGRKSFAVTGNGIRPCPAKRRNATLYFLGVVRREPIFRRVQIPESACVSKFFRLIPIYSDPRGFPDKFYLLQRCVIFNIGCGSSLPLLGVRPELHIRGSGRKSQYTGTYLRRFDPRRCGRPRCFADVLQCVSHIYILLADVAKNNQVRFAQRFMNASKTFPCSYYVNNWLCRALAYLQLLLIPF